MEIDAADRNSKKQTEKKFPKLNQGDLTKTDLMEIKERHQTGVYDDDQETILNVAVKRPNFDITGAQTYVRACKMQHVVPCTKLTKQLAAEGNTELKLPYYGLADNGTMALSIALLVNTSVTCLYLRGNNIGDKGISYIQKMMVENTSITDLDLSENNLKESGAKTVAAMLDTNRFIQKIDISGNEFTDSDARVLATSIEVHPVLEWVNLSHNAFGDSSSQVFEHLLEQSKLLYLDISWNLFRTHGALHISTGLKRLDFFVHHIRPDKCVTHIAIKSTKENTYLKTLNVSWNGYDDEGGAAFGDALANNSFLTELDISSCRIATEGFAKLMAGLKSNERLEVLKVGGNYVSKEAIDTALDALQTFDPGTSKITMIDVTGLHLPRSVDDKMHEVRKVLPSLKIKPGWEEDKSVKKEKAKLLDSGTEGLLAIKRHLEARNISVFKLFREFDNDNSDTIDYSEFAQGIKAANIPLSYSKICSLVKVLDVDCDGEIELKELVAKLKEVTLFRSKTVA